ncbi:MAG: MBL fold metallo-hydrolase [Undibacterium sp.]|uniref:MBL fold metallo-hydrolase n=1 Tax=Undibacterium sp. TaxID=1914977 RepID=UPI00271B63D6|nr:MBL fold metallo-hydrolase [Undibacterium sp.]MDO8650750.1 MBL fold metallo-hydrolase [Undibacterium sp.]
MALDQAITLPAGIHVFERGWLSSNNILLIDDDSAALVDSGYLTHAEQTLALVQHGLNGRSLTTLINTHLHSDHCGGNALLQRTYDCRTLIPVADAPAVAVWDEQVLTYKATGQQCERFRYDGCIAPGDQLRLAGLQWQVMAAPGHDPHSMILYCASEAILISADALWEHGFGVIFPELIGESGFAEQAAVLQLIAELEVRLVIPGHGAPFTNVAAALDRARSRLDYLSADSSRNARNALKVLIAFLLLDSQQFSLQEVTEHIRSSRLMTAAAAQLATPIDLLIRQLAGELVSAGAARMDGERLISTR